MMPVSGAARTALRGGIQEEDILDAAVAGILGRDGRVAVYPPLF